MEYARAEAVQLLARKGVETRGHVVTASVVVS